MLKRCGACYVNNRLVNNTGIIEQLLNELIWLKFSLDRATKTPPGQISIIVGKENDGWP